MVSAIKELPDIYFQPKTHHQRNALSSQKNYWGWIGLRIDFLLLKQSGYLPEDPANDKNLHPFHSKTIDVMSCYYFAILEIVIKAFPTIQEAAIREKRQFTFENPRNLFIQICRDLANGGTASLRSEELNQGLELKRLRKNLRLWNAFYKDSLEDNKDEILLHLQKGDWSEFWIFAIWKYRHKKELRNTWKNFLQNHTNVCRFTEKNDYSGVKVSTQKWNKGKSYRSDSGKPIESWGFWHMATKLNIP
jgi:hypothetical protein